MTNNEYQLYRIEETIEGSRKAIALQEALVRLESNEDFIAVISNGLFKEEAERLCKAKANPNMLDDLSQQIIVGQIDTIGGLVQYFSKIFQEGNQAHNSLEGDEATRNELMGEV